MLIFRPEAHSQEICGKMTKSNKNIIYREAKYKSNQNSVICDHTDQWLVLSWFDKKFY